MSHNGNKKISLLQYCILIFLSSGPLFEGLILPIMYNKVEQDTVITLILGIVISIFVILLFLYIANFRPELNVIEKGEIIYGKVINSILIFILIIIATFMFMAMLSTLDYFTSSKYLTHTPKLTIIYLFMIVAAYVCTKGIEVMARVGEILFMFMMLVNIVMVPFALSTFQATNLQPLLTHQPTTILDGALLFATGCLIPISIILIIPKNSVVNDKNFNVAVYFSMLFSVVMLALITVLTMGTTNLEVLKIVQFPTYYLLKKVEIGTFFRNIENLFSLYWIIHIFMFMILAIYLVGKYVKNIFNTKKSNILNLVFMIIAILIVWLTNFVYPEPLDDLRFIEHKFPYYVGIPFIIYFIITSLLIYIKRKNKTA